MVIHNDQIMIHNDQIMVIHNDQIMVIHNDQVMVIHNDQIMVIHDGKIRMVELWGWKVGVKYVFMEAQHGTIRSLVKLSVSQCQSHG